MFSNSFYLFTNEIRFSLCIFFSVLMWIGETSMKKHPKKSKHFGYTHKLSNGGHRTSKHHRIHKHHELKHANVFKLKPEPELSTQQQNYHRHQSSSSSSIENIQQKPHPKKSMTTDSDQPQQHMSVHIMNMNVNEMDADDDDDVDEINNGQTKAQKNTLTPLNVPYLSSIASVPIPAVAASTSTTTTTYARIPENIFNSNIPILDGGSQPVVLNDRVTSISVIEENENGQKLFIGSSRVDVGPAILPKNNNESKPVILVNAAGTRDGSTSSTNDDNNDGNTEKGYFEKTIVNKNGVFIENIRKIPYKEQQRDLVTTDDGTVDSTTAAKQKNNESTGISTTSNDDNYDRDDDNINVNGQHNTLKSTLDNLNGKINRKSIEMMNNVPVVHAQHYVITSSGKIEQTNALASDDIVTQFQSGLNSNNNNNVESSNSKVNDQQQQQPEQTHQNSQLISNVGDSVQSSSSSSATIASATSNILNSNFGRQRNLPGGTFLTTINSAIPALVTTSTLSDTTNSNCIVMGKYYFSSYLRFNFFMLLCVCGQLLNIAKVCDA